MYRSHVVRTIATAASLAVLATGCGLASADPVEPNGAASAPPGTATPEPSVRPEPTATPRPTPAETPRPTVTPAVPASADPTPVPPTAPGAPLDAPALARSTADGVRVRWMPGLAAPILSGHRWAVEPDPFVPEVTLSEGDHVVVHMGPVHVDGHAWYAVTDEEEDDLTWAYGWVAGEYLVEAGPMPERFSTITSLHGYGAGSQSTGAVGAAAVLGLNAVAAPLSGDASCEITIEFVGVDGRTLVVHEVISEPTSVGRSPLRATELHQPGAGAVSLEVASDCSWAAAVTLSQI